MTSAFHKLHRDIQNVLWDMKWTQLYQFQAESIHAWFDTSQDILLRDLGNSELIEQVEGGDLILGIEGERIISHYDFFAAFETPRTYQVHSNICLCN